MSLHPYLYWPRAATRDQVRYKCCGIFLLVSLLGGCSDQEPTQEVTAPAHPSMTATAISDTSDLVSTPNGLYHRNCVYAIPEGATIKGGVIVSRDGSTSVVPTCLQPGPVSVGMTPLGAQRNSIVPPGIGAWAVSAKAASYQGTGRTIRYLGARWIVPEIPGTYGGSTSVNYLFPGAVNSASTPTIVQPVLQYGVSYAGGGQYWSIAPWMCGAICVHGALQTVSVGDVIGGTVYATSCGAGKCDWTISVVDSTHSAFSTMFVPSGALNSSGQTDDNYVNPVGGAFEFYNQSTCANLTGGPHVFSQIAFRDNTGTAMNPSWSINIDPSVSPSCGWNGSVGGTTTVTLLDTLAPVLTVAINGPTGVPLASSGTWTPNVGLVGSPPYTYQWTGILFGTAASISGVPSSSGMLTLQIWDTAGHSASSSLYVTVCAPTEFIC